MNAPHIASIEYAAVYAPAFPSLEEARAFVQQVDSQRQRRASLILHQVARMVWLADRIDEVARGRPAFQIAFYSIAAEAAAKIFFEYEGERDSCLYVHRFFEEICEPEDSKPLASAFWPINSGRPLPLSAAVDFLYDVRCDVFHRGIYYERHLRQPGEPDWILDVWDRRIKEKGAPARFERISFAVRLTLPDLRLTVLSGAVRACRRIASEARGASLGAAEPAS